MRTCSICNKLCKQNTPICEECRRKGSKHQCPIEGCTELINSNAKTCLKHRRRAGDAQPVFTHCTECNAPLERGDRRVCKSCREIFVLCACGCGKYRKKFSRDGLPREYISGHNDAWATHRRPNVICPMCGKSFKAAFTRQKLCSIECRARWLTINPSNERKRQPVECVVCGKVVYRTPSEIRGKETVCSAECRCKLVSDRLKGQNISSPRKLAAERDGHKCVICGFDVLVEVHHIVPRKRTNENGDDDLDNLITLCPNHHTMADRDLISRDELRAYLHKP